ncbi:tumor necrosis factor b (TNF superfamily, member 2) [Thalassophryne amazonica]|uniref:tumor necrosis factor b (TNF superfamily, member 2) n=1 Tax=Thalassophryne amazonica TaxID=390379 RepID=UPI001470A6BD|nr:tumor necrosis factor b (TNF superfamily, member 2) [Thalassophryne amazonica]
MVAYTTTPCDVEVGTEERTVVLVEQKSSSARICKMWVALLVVALCLGVIVVCVWYWSIRPAATVQSNQTEKQTEVAASAAAPKTTDPHDTLRRISSNAKVAIHLEGIYDESVKHQLEWRNGQGQAFAQGGFQVVDNQIIIPQSGIYFVYSQASFRVTCSDEEEENVGKRHTPLSHRIWRYSDSVGSKTSLMSAVRSACQSSPQEDGVGVGQGWYNAIYLGAVFQLNKGDKLWTETNQLAELETEEGKTFFGVFAL